MNKQLDKFLNACLENNQNLMLSLINKEINYIDVANFVIENKQDQYLTCVFIQENCFRFNIGHLVNFLDLAAYNDNLEAFKILDDAISKKASIKNRIDYYTISLFLAISKEHWNIVQYIENVGFPQEEMKKRINDEKLERYILNKKIEKELTTKDVKINKSKI